MTTYTTISKPTGTTYENLNPVGKQQYDQDTISYDDATIFYDGLNPGQYTNITKPTYSVTTIVAGSATGLLMAPTYPENVIIGMDPYTYISKP